MYCLAAVLWIKFPSCIVVAVFRTGGIEFKLALSVDSEREREEEEEEEKEVEEDEVEEEE